MMPYHRASRREEAIGQTQRLWQQPAQGRERSCAGGLPAEAREAAAPPPDRSSRPAPTSRCRCSSSSCQRGAGRHGDAAHRGKCRRIVHLWQPIPQQARRARLGLARQRIVGPPPEPELVEVREQDDSAEVRHGANQGLDGQGGFPPPGAGKGDLYAWAPAPCSPIGGKARSTARPNPAPHPEPPGQPGDGQEAR